MLRKGRLHSAPFRLYPKYAASAMIPVPVEKIPARSCHNTEFIAGYNIDA